MNILKDLASDAEIENNYYLPEQLLREMNSSQKEMTLESKRECTYNAVKQMIYLADEDLNQAFLYYRALPWKAFRINFFALSPCYLPLLLLKTGRYPRHVNPRQSGKTFSGTSE